MMDFEEAQMIGRRATRVASLALSEAVQQQGVTTFGTVSFVVIPGVTPAGVKWIAVAQSWGVMEGVDHDAMLRMARAEIERELAANAA